MTTTLEAGLSTAPDDTPLPPSGGRQLLAPLRRTWRQLTSMRTALLLLFLLALAAVPGGFLPQRSTSPERVVSYLQQHPALGPLLDRLSAFDVFGSPWFSAVYTLLFISLVGCLGPRLRLHLRALRTPPPPVPAVLGRLPVSARWETDLAPEQVAAAARRVLRRRRFRTTSRTTADGLGLSAEKGYLRETGNLLFHLSLVGLLVGIAVGGFYGFKGTVLVKEGDGFASTVLNYDDVHPGRRFAAADLVPLHLTLRQFHASYTAEGKARTFDAELTWGSGTDPAERPYDLRVNSPLAVGGAKVYLLGHGYAPHVVVRDAQGHVALDQEVPCLPQDTHFLSNCVIKVPDAQPTQLGFQGVFTPTTAIDPVQRRLTSTFPGARDPALTLLAYGGDLGLDAGGAQSVYSLDTRGLKMLSGGLAMPAHTLHPGDTWRLPGGGSITYAATNQWVTLQVTQDPGKGLALASAVGIVLGLLLSLFVRRRRAWVRVGRPDGGTGRTVVQVGGLARTDLEAFREEFTELTSRLRAATGATHPSDLTPEGAA